MTVSIAACDGPRETRSASPPPAEPATSVQEDPLGGGRRVTLDEAKDLVAFDIPVPPTDSETGEQTGIWVTPSQVAFVWATDLRFYASPSELTEREAARSWAKVVEEEPQLDWKLTTTRGHRAIGRNGGGDRRPSTLTWIENRQSLQFVAPQHTLAELKRYAEAITFESD